MTDASTAQPGTPTPRVSLDVVVLDCPDPSALADFYCRLLGWEVAYADEDWVTIKGPTGGVALGFQRAPDYQPPTWPTGPRPQMLHLDFDVPDLEAAHAHAVAVGAKPTGLPESPSASFWVYTDPDGHPFCLCKE